MDIQLTQEMKEKLKKAGALGFQLDAKFPYVPKAYRGNDIPKSLWPIFFLRGVDGVDSARLEDEMRGKISYEGDNTSVIINSGKVRVKTICLGITDWKNFRNENGELIPSPKKNDVSGGIMEDSARCLHPDLQTELVNAITEHSILTDEELLGLEL